MVPAFSLSCPSGVVPVGHCVNMSWNSAAVPIGSQFRLYYDSDGSFNGNEVYITVNLDPVASGGQYSWATVLVPAGTYTLGALVVNGTTGHIVASSRLSNQITITYSDAIVVNSTHDVVVSGSVVTLRAAIQQANAQLDGNAQVITFDPSLNGQQITLSGFELPITNKIYIDGPGTGQLTIDANNLSRVFDIKATRATCG